MPETPTEPTQSPQTGSTQSEFAHPVEAAFAHILDYYGIRWEYEPRSFELVRDDNGSLIEAFTPDFYLPEQDLFIELTTLRPGLTTHKNRKLRRMRELYPEINLKLFKRRDLRDLLVKYGFDKDAAGLMGTAAQGNHHGNEQS